MKRFVIHIHIRFIKTIMKFTYKSCKRMINHYEQIGVKERCQTLRGRQNRLIPISAITCIFKIHTDRVCRKSCRTNATMGARASHPPIVCAKLVAKTVRFCANRTDHRYISVPFIYTIFRFTRCKTNTIFNTKSELLFWFFSIASQRTSFWLQLQNSNLS